MAMASSISTLLLKSDFASSSTRTLRSCASTRRVFCPSSITDYPFRLRSRASTRRGFCHASTANYPFQELESHLQDLGKSLYPNLITLQSFFHAPDDREIHLSCRRGFGVFLDPTLVVTSAHVVGRVAAFTESNNVVDEPDRFERGQIRHKSYIGSTVGLTADHRILNAMPLAVSFGKDVAVLKVVVTDNEEDNLFPNCVKVVDTLPREDDVMVAIAQGDIFLGNVRAIGEKTVRAKAPWLLDDKLGWMEHDWSMWRGGNTPPLSEKVTGSITRLSGSPWFNLQGEVVGIASWEVVDLSVGFAVPSSCIRDVVEYAKSKGHEDPIVVDNWIDAHMIPRLDD